MKKVQTGFRLFVLVFSLLIIPIELLAEEIPTLYRGIRPLGMGGAFTAVSDDANGLFYNPAGLHGETKLMSMDIFNPQIEVSEDSGGLFSDVSDLDGANLPDVINFLQDRVGEHQHVRFSLFPNVIVRNYGIGVLAQGTADIEIRNAAIPNVPTDVKTDLGLVGGGAIGLPMGFQVGLSAQFIQRQGIKKTYTAFEIAGGQFDPLDDLESEFDFAFDLGGMYHLGESWKAVSILDPTIGIVIQHITDLDFDTLGKLPTQLNLGFALRPNFWILKTTLSADVLDITKEVGEDEDYKKRTHLGLEVQLPVVLGLRLGLNQGYFTAGASIDLWVLKLEYATYAEEIGVFAGQRDDRRHVFLIGFGI